MPLYYFLLKVILIETFFSLVALETNNLLFFCNFRSALSDIFEVIDLDGNGLLSLEEYNFFELRTSGEKCDEDAWAVCRGKHFSFS